MKNVLSILCSILQPSVLGIGPDCLNDWSFSLCVFNYLKFYKLSEIILRKLQNALRTRRNN